MQDTTDTFAEYLSAELIWVKPKWSRLQFELRAGDTVVATLNWARASRAEARWGATAYRFSRKGWWRPRILVRGADARETDEPLATFASHGGALTFPDGRTFVWKKPRRLTSEHMWVDSGGVELIRFQPARRSTVAVSIQPEAIRLPELPLLILLGQYLIALAAQDANAASSAATVAVIASS